MPTPLLSEHRGPPVATAGAPRTGLVLTGGGARAAYQAGALRAVIDILDPARSASFRFPFDIVCGTSAGAINATALAAGAHHPHVSLRRLNRLWASLTTAQVYRADAPGLLRTGVRWLGLLSLGWMFSGWVRRKPRSLLDNAPLAGLLDQALDFEQLQCNLEQGHLAALAVTASGYNSGQHLTFYQSHDGIEPWQRALRRAVPARISTDHLMASSAIPFIFPARSLAVEGKVEWCWDGSMRQLAPISPAIRLGADRVLVIGSGHRSEVHPEARSDDPPYPSLAQIGGHALSNIFLDSVAMDIERLADVNALLDDAGGPDGASLVHASPSGMGSPRPIRVLALSPNTSLDDLALAHMNDLPGELLALFRVLGISPDAKSSGGGSLLSYLLFEGGYTRRLIELGYADTMQRSAEVIEFFDAP